MNGAGDSVVVVLGARVVLGDKVVVSVVFGGRVDGNVELGNKVVGVGARVVELIGSVVVELMGLSVVESTEHFPPKGKHRSSTESKIQSKGQGSSIGLPSTHKIYMEQSARKIYIY